MILLIDNYDSFTYNLYQYLRESGARVRVTRNDALSAGEALALRPKKIVLSPGPGRPDNAGICLDLVRQAAGKIPMLGVCLGHQAIAQAFGGKIVSAPRLMHGKTSRVRHDRSGVFRGLPNPLEATRYHSLTVSPDRLPRPLRVTATAGGVVMGIKHRELPIHGVQFHPESILTRGGMKLIKNFITENR